MNDYKKIIINKQHSDSYLDYKYFEVAELMDDNEIKENVKSFINEKLISSKISNEVDEFKLERPFRTLCSIGSEEDELWILDIMKEFYDSIKRHTLNRVLNCLAIFGTNKSYNLIKKIAKDHLNIPFVLNNCYYAYSRINQKSDIYSEIYGEEILN
jgi:hypothetical protein